MAKLSKASPNREEERSEGEPPSNSIAKNSIFLLIYNVLNVVFPLVTGIYVAHILLPADVGAVAFAQNIAQYFVILAFLGLPTYGLREIAKARKNREDLEKIHSELFFLNLISTCIFSAIYLILIFSVNEFREDLPLYLIVGLAIALNALDNSWLYEGLEEFKLIAIRNISFKSLAFILLVIFVRSPSDSYLYAMVTVIGVAGNNLFNILFSRKFVRFRLKGLNLKRHLKPVLLLVVVNLAIEIYTLVDTTMLGFFCEDEIVAFYSYGSKINRVLLQIINTFTIVVVPRLSLYYKEERQEEFNGLLTSAFRVILLLSLPMIVGVQFVSNYLICLIYGDVYLSSAYVLRILSAVLLISPIGYLLGSRVMLVTGKEWKMVVSVGTGAVVNIVGNLILIPHFAEYGAAAASVVSEIVVTIVYLLFSWKFFRLGAFWKSLIKELFAVAAMGGYLFLCTYLPLGKGVICAIQFVGAILLYFGILIILREESVFRVFQKAIRKFHK